MKRPKNADGEMSAVIELSNRLVRETMIERNVKKPEARRTVAREAGILPGTLENLERRRLKNIGKVSEAINAYLVRRVEAKISQLESELVVARLACSRVDQVDVIAAQAALEEAKRLLGK